MADLSLRELFKATGLALGVSSASLAAFAEDSPARDSGTLSLKFGGYPFPRLRST
jgi:hypothetical protein